MGAAARPSIVAHRVRTTSADGFLETNHSPQFQGAVPIWKESRPIDTGGRAVNAEPTASPLGLSISQAGEFQRIITRIDVVGWSGPKIAATMP